MAHDRESEPEPAMSARSRAIRLAKALEDMRQKLRRDARPRVAHLDLHVSFILADTNTDRSSDRRELRSIRQQVPHDLLQTIDIARDHLEPILKLRLYADILYFERRPDRIECSIHHRDLIDWAEVKLKFSGYDARHIENVFDDLFLRPRISFDHFDSMNRAFIVEATGFQDP